MTPSESQILGYWWFPETPNERWVGTLFLNDNDSPRLKIIVPRAWHDFDKVVPSVIHGYNRDGNPITILFPGRAGGQFGPAISEIEFHGGYAVLGLEVPSSQDFNVSTLMLRMQHLYEWCGISGIQSERNGTVHNFELRYSYPETLSYRLNDHITLELHAAYSFHDGVTRKELEEDLTAAFVSEKGFNLKDLSDLVDAWRHLLHFALLKEVYPTRITAWKDGYGRKLQGDVFAHHDIQLWSSIIRERVKSEFLAQRWIFKFSDVKADFGTFMSKWIAYTKTYEEALDCYFMTIYHRPPDSVEHLSLTQALEAYHGMKFSSHKKQDFEDKIRELATRFQTNLLGLVDDPADFAKTVLHNRHYYTHHNPKWKEDGRVVSDKRLFQLNEKLKLIFQMCVLADMGIPEDRFVRLRRQLATHIVDYI